MKTKAWAMAIVLFFTILPKISNAQNSDDIFSNSSDNPFEGGSSRTKSTSDEIYYDTSNQAAPPFFDMSSGIGHPFGPAVGGASSGGDPEGDADAPIDDYLGNLFLIMLGLTYRNKIKMVFKTNI